MNSIIDQQRDNEDFMYCIDTLRDILLKNYNNYCLYQSTRGYNTYSEVTMDDVYCFAIQRGVITLNDYINLRKNKNK